MLSKNHWLQSTYFKLLATLLCSVLLLGLGLFVRPALAKQTTAPQQRVLTYWKPAAVSWTNPKKTFVFIITAAQDISYRTLDGTTLTWGAWKSLGTPPYEGGGFRSVEVISRQNGTLDVFGIDVSGAVFYKYIFTTSAGTLGVTDWEQFTGSHSQFQDGFRAVAWASNRLDLFGKVSGNTFYHKWLSNGVWSTGWEVFDNGSGYLDAASWGADRLDVFKTDTANGGEVSHAYWDGSSWQPAIGWESMSGTSSAMPFVLARSFNRLDVFIRGGSPGSPTKDVYYKRWTGNAWSGWQNIGGNSSASGGSFFTRTVTGVSWGPSRMDIFEVTVFPSGVFHKAYNDGIWSPSTTKWESIGGGNGINQGLSIAVTSWGPNRLDIFATGTTDQSIRHLAWNGSSWTPNISNWEIINP